MYKYNKKNLIIIVMAIASLFMAVGYALLSTRLDISSAGNLSGSWNVRFTNVTSTAVGRAYNISDPTYTGTTVRFNVGVKVPGDKMIFKVTVENAGNIDAILQNINATVSGANEIVYKINGISENEILKAGAKKTFEVTTEFDINATQIPAATKDLVINLNFVQHGGETPDTNLPQIENVTTQYAIRYNANGGTGTMDYTICEKGKSCTLRTNAFGANGTFKGWGTSPEGPVIYTDKQKVTDIAEPGETIELYAIWELQHFLVNYILSDNTAYADNVASPFVTSSSGIDFNKISSDTNGKGLYYTNENTEDEKTTYYFRGDVQNNYVKFGKDKDGNDLYWRIIRINEDGTVRMIYQGTSATATGNNATIGTSGFNTSYNDNAYVGYMYGTPGSSTYALTHANTNDSTIKTYIDNWYSTKTNLSTYVTTHLADSGFCNDRRPWDGTGAGASVTTYGMLIRLDTKASFECPNASNDLFTTSASSKGNKALTNPIGLITADEVVYAGGESSTSNSSYYLYTGSTYWTMSPLSGSSYYGELFVSVVGINDKGELDKITTDIIIGGVRPVVNLQSTVEISDGNGTATNPYVIKNN